MWETSTFKASFHARLNVAPQTVNPAMRMPTAVTKAVI
jgi:hypothetical protein